MMNQLSIPRFLIAGLATLLLSLGNCIAETINVSSLYELMDVAQKDGQTIILQPGVYSVKDYFTPERLEQLKKVVPNDRSKRHPVPILSFGGNDNTYEFADVIFEIDTAVYNGLPYGYTRVIFFAGNNNTFRNLTVRNTGEDQGSNGNTLTVWGDGNTLENITVYVRGSTPYGYGDLLGKGGPNLVSLKKQSGIMIGGDNNTLKRCQVISRAFGHCFYIQGARNTVLEDCYAEGTTRATNEMLRETSGLAFDHDFKSVYENRDGRFVITSGYSKSLTEDGFRTYGGGGPKGQRTGATTLINCRAYNTRAGFELYGPDGDDQITLTRCTAQGTERGFLLINGNIVARQCRGDIVHGPLLYLWKGSNADVEIEVFGEPTEFTVHALATISGEDQRVKLTRFDPENKLPHLPIMLGYGMPAHAEMSTPILAESTSGIDLINQTGMPLIISKEAVDCDVLTDGPVQINDGSGITIKEM